MKDNNGRKIWQWVGAVVGTIIVSILGAFYVFGAQQQEQLVRFEQSEAEDARQRQVDLATIQALNLAIRNGQAQISALEARVSVLETRLDLNTTPSE